MNAEIPRPTGVGILLPLRSPRPPQPLAPRGGPLHGPGGLFRRRLAAEPEVPVRHRKLLDDAYKVSSGRTIRKGKLHGRRRRGTTVRGWSWSRKKLPKDVRGYLVNLMPNEAGFLRPFCIYPSKMAYPWNSSTKIGSEEIGGRSPDFPF